MRTIQTVCYCRGETPVIGTVVVVDRKDGCGGREEVQRYTLAGVGGEEHPTDMGLSYKLNWQTACTECGTTFEASTNNYTKNLPRRCKPCRRKNPYNACGWSSRPRNRYVRIDPAPGEPHAPPVAARGVDIAQASVTPLYDALGSATRMAWLRRIKAETGTTPAPGDVEARLRAESEIDPASLF
jgi:hypothetical protein